MNISPHNLTFHPAVDPEFMAAIPSLTAQQEQWLDEDRLEFRITNWNAQRLVEIHPSENFGYWHFKIIHVDAGFEEFTKRPVARSHAMLISDVVKAIRGGIVEMKHFTAETKGSFAPKNEPIKAKKTTLSVYVVQAVTGGPVKIGISNDVASRMKIFQMGCPFLLKVLMTFDGVKFEKESEFHRLFRSSRIHGEWFSEAIIPALRALHDNHVALSAASKAVRVSA